MMGATDFCATVRVRLTVSEVHSMSTTSDSALPSPIVLACRKSACVRSIRFSTDSAELASKRTVRCVYAGRLPFSGTKGMCGISSASAWSGLPYQAQT